VLIFVNLFEDSGDVSIKNDGQVVTNLNGVLECKEPKNVFGHIAVNQDSAGRAYNVFPV
jgi:hypothetical protein